MTNDTIPRLVKRNGVYNITWRAAPKAGAKEGATKRLGLRTRDPGEAKARFAAFLSHGQAELDAATGDAGLTVAAAIDQYIREHAHARDDKGRPVVADPRRQEDAAAHLREHFGQIALSSVDIPACRDYTRARREGRIGGKGKGAARRAGSDATIRRELSVLKAVFNHALKWKRISLHDAPTFESPKAAEDDESTDVKWFTKDQLAVLLGKCDMRIAEAALLGDEKSAAAEQRFRDWIEITYAWGARKRSTEALQVEQVSLGRVENDVQAPSAAARSGLSPWQVNLHPPGTRRTKKRRPIVPVYERIRPTLTRLVENADEGWLFGKRVNFYRRFVELCNGCGFGGHPHMLRHSRATHMLMDGENPYKVAKLLGDTLTTVLRVYGHHSPDFLKDDE